MSQPLNDARQVKRPRSLSWVVIVQWAWLVALSILLFAVGRSAIDVKATQSGAVSTQQLQALEQRIAAQEESNQARLVQAPSATQQALQNLRAALEGRLDRLEQQTSGEGHDSQFEALRSEFEQIKTQMAVLKTSAERAARRKVARPAPAAPTVVREDPLPFRVLGVERRAGQVSASVAPADGALAANTIQIVLPGESLGKWRLEAVEGSTVTFRAGEQVRRVALPWLSPEP
ncbi:TPA: hypothetical protein ACNFRY_005756 [Pseudomonas aeruginosa]|nr:hypothetical protein [Pseudomonas aeruginosa]HBO3291868.1 hypothetical protein [Pseudomonas aeruginosa]